MNMKAITLMSLSALALAGAACSETQSATKADTEPTEAAQVTETSEDSGFNLSLFEDEADSGFNLNFEDETSDPMTGFDFGDASEPSLLDNLPEVEAPTLPDADEAPVKLPEIPNKENDIIRLQE